METHDKKEVEREFDALMTARDITVVPDRKAGALACYQDLKHLTASLRQSRSAMESEPSNIYSLNALLRSIGNIP